LAKGRNFAGRRYLARFLPRSDLDGSFVQMVQMDIGEHCGIEQRLVAGLAVHLVAQLGGADVVVEIGEDGQQRLLSRVIGEAISIGLVMSLLVEWIESNAGRQAGGEIVEIFIGPRGDNEIGQKGQFSGAMPLVERAEGVGAEEQEERGFLRQGIAEAGQSIDGKVWGGAGWLGSVGQGDLKTGVAGDGQASHGHTVLEAGGGSSGFQRLQADGREEHPIEMESSLGGAGHGHMADMRRVETASEKGHVRATGWGWTHWDMVIE